MTFYGTVENGELTLNDEDSYERFLTSLIGEVQITVEKKKVRRSSKENRYGHGLVFSLLSDVTGYELSEVKELLMRLCGFVRDVRGVEIARSTASLSTVEWEELMRRGRALGDELGIYIPLPNEYGQ